MVASVTVAVPLEGPSGRGQGGPLLCMHASPGTVRVRRRLPAEGGTRPWLLELEIEVTIPDPEEILAACEGFLVDDSNGRDVGVVEEVETGPDGAALSLLVAGGWFGRRRRRIPVDAIETIEPGGRRIVVRA